MKLDLRQGYHQLKLDPASRAIATFSTPWRNYRPKWLVFGAKASQDLFDETIQTIFGDIPWCIKQRDDIMIGVHDWAKHNATLEEVLQWMEDFGITLNLHKCELELKFYGYRFSENGLIPTPDKVRAVKECTEPKSKMAVWSFPGMRSYLAKFIPRYAALTKSPRDLTHNETKFHWGQDEQEAFEKLKESISNEDTIAFFNSRLPTIVRTNTSYNEGLSAALF